MNSLVWLLLSASLRFMFDLLRGIGGVLILKLNAKPALSRV